MTALPTITPTITNETLAAALNHAAQGRRVFPCKPDKTPWVGHWKEAATTDPEVIKAWWELHPNGLVGLPTGRASGFFVIDVDEGPGKVGEASLSGLTDCHGELPGTIVVRTPRGGYHRYYQYPAGEVPNSASRLAKDVDVRGEGGYVIAPGSVLPDGRRYEWDGGSTKLAAAPVWLIALVSKKQAPRGIRLKSDKSDNPTWKGDGPIPEGERNATLASFGGLLRRRGLEQAEILEALMGLNSARCSPPLPDGEVAGIAASVSRYAPAEGFETLEGTPDGDTDGVAWPDPQSITAKVEAKPYPLDALPATILAAVEEVAGFVQAPIPLVVGSALAAVSVACQGLVDVQRAEKLQGPSGLFLLSIADSGERKTTCDGFFASAIRQWESEQADTMAPDLQRYAAALDAWDAERDGLLSAIKAASAKGTDTAKLKADLARVQGDKPKAPRVPRLLLGDETPESLAWTLAHQWPSAGVVSSEAGLIFGAHGMGKESVLRNLALLNVLWDGGTHSVGRRTSESFIVRGARLTVGLQIQEAPLRDFFERTGTLARGTGFLARFLLSCPESTQGKRPFRESPTTWPALARFHRRIAETLAVQVPMDATGGLEPALLTLAPDTKAAWIAFHDEVEAELADGGELRDVRDVASKTADNAVRLAALFCRFEGGIGPVGLAAFEGASRLAAWHLSEARRFFGELALPEELANAARLDAWLIAYCRRERTSQVGKSVALQYGPARTKGALDGAIKELSELDRLRVAKDGRRTVLKVNPGILGFANANPANPANTRGGKPLNMVANP